MDLKNTIAEVENEDQFGQEAQTFVSELELTTETKIDQSTRKRKATKKRATSPKKPRVLADMPDPDAESFLGVLELFWMKTMVQNLMEILILCQEAMNKKDLEMKRLFMKVTSYWKTILKSIVQKEKKLESVSWDTFRQILFDSGLYMTLSQLMMRCKYFRRYFK
ncbi:hypothetical protein JYU34_010273 [Plutella xylostella]|uniref:Uncharacterized protein n=1 Tax=Plutella xylostella TaxID=51655 RepID=A0ABQ7QIK0_PLUXY|nr:hypothetical protein JYU34_010273 [Plutella xylostella]